MRGKHFGRLTKIYDKKASLNTLEAEGNYLKNHGMNYLVNMK